MSHTTLFLAKLLVLMDAFYYGTVYGDCEPTMAGFTGLEFISDHVVPVSAVDVFQAAACGCVLYPCNSAAVAWNCMCIAFRLVRHLKGLHIYYEHRA